MKSASNISSFIKRELSLTFSLLFNFQKRNHNVYLRYVFLLLLFIYLAFALTYPETGTHQNLIKFILICPILISVVALTSFTPNKKILDSYASIAIIITGFGSTYFSLLKGTYYNFHYPGILSIILFQYLLLKLDYKKALINGAIISLTYITAISFIEDNILKNTIQFSLLLITNIIGYGINYILHSNFQKNTLLITQKDEEIKQLKKIINRQELLLNNHEKENVSQSQTISKQEEQIGNYEKKLAQESLKAQEAENLKRSFLTNLSHEIRTPMNGIVGFVELLKSPHLSEEKKEKYLGLISKNSKQLLNVLNNILDISRLETNQIELYEEKFCLNELLKTLRKEFNRKPEVIRKNLQINLFLSFEEKQSVITSDFRKINSILYNLLDNAVKYTNSGNIEIGYTLKDPKNLLFYIMDTGIGIPKEKQKVIFKRFTRLEQTADANFPGSGLGLSICKGLVELMKGEIGVQSKEYEGSTFYFSIPYHPQFQTNTTKSIDYLPEQPFIFKDKKILVVEDDIFSKKLLKEILSKTKAKTFFTDKGEEAINICKEEHFDLVLMDLQIKGINGYNTIKEIKRIKPTLPIIVQSAFSLQQDIERGFISGCNDYIIKPIERKKLLAKINRQLWLKVSNSYAKEY